MWICILFLKDWGAIKFCQEYIIKIAYFLIADVEVLRELDIAKLEQSIKKQVLKYYG